MDLTFETARVWDGLKERFEGELHLCELRRRIYATDASEYQEMPAAVALPRTEADIRELILFAAQHRIGLIPRTAGTSLAGQVVGGGIVVDVGRHLNGVLGVDARARRVRVQPGVIRNELNLALQAEGLFFAPETSTANRAMIGGMVGNNSCGANSIVYGSTRDHLISIRGFLSDGSSATFGPLTREQFNQKCAGPESLETRIYRTVREILESTANRELVRAQFPKPSVTRRNTGYALDGLMTCEVFDDTSAEPFNLCRLLAGSEGTLFFGVEYELNCEPLPPPGGLICAHFANVHQALQGTVIAMRYQPFGCELIDRKILECAKSNLEQAKNLFWIQGDPGAVVVIELRHADRALVEAKMGEVEADLKAAGLGYAFPVLWGAEGNSVWELRRAGQGLMMNVPGDAKPREVVEDTAVAVEDLPAYIAEFDRLLREKYGLSSVYYAHAGAGELHTRPLFDLQSDAGRKLFRGVATDVAALVKKYRGSLSGEHGDGRLRGEFIPFMVGAECFELMRRIKAVFDPQGIFNPGKIIDTPPMDTSLRHPSSPVKRSEKTVFKFQAEGGILRAAEKCNGVGECRKTHLAGGTMCPSYMATRDERDTTRARANLLRQFLTEDGAAAWTSPAVGDAMDLCLSCKGCKAECPSNVDVARLKAEWLQQRHDRLGAPWRSRVVAHFASAMRVAARAPRLYNWAATSPRVSRWAKQALGFSPARSLPVLHATTLRAWHARHANPPHLEYPNGRVFLFCDEFTDFNDVPIGIQTVELLNILGYRVEIPRHVDSGRALFSKGFVRRAQKLAIANVGLLKDVVSEAEPLVGIEPSALLSFRDEYLDLMPDSLQATARQVSESALLIDEFLARERDRGRIVSSSFRAESRQIKLHGHCHQKALSSLGATIKALELPKGYVVSVIPSGCCGMAGSFGYEKEHHDLSLQIGELVLLPSVRATPKNGLIAASGTSCRHQIRDGANRVAFHPVEILHQALVARPLDR